MPNKSEREPSSIPVLVVGDWLVDEYWVAGKHRSSTSTRTGRHHARVLHTAEASVRSLCGAGQVATILHQALHHGHRVFDLSGIGIWHPDDTSALAAMLEPESSVGKTPHRLAEDQEPVPPSGCTLYSLAARSNVKVGTTRIIRIYESEKQQLELTHRLDWELPLTTAQHRKLRRNIDATLAKTFGKRQIGHILVKDLLKGSVDGVVIEALRNRFRNAQWYISSKEWSPKWLEKIPRQHVKLIFIPPKAAQRARSKGVIASNWLTEGVPSREAIDAVKGLGGRFPAASVIIVPDEFRIVAYEPAREEEQARGFVVSQDRPAEPTTAMASIFFASVVSHLASLPDRLKGDSPPRPGLELALQESLTFTRRWQNAERMRLTNYSWKPQQEQILAIHDHGQRGNWQAVDWNQSAAQWKAAFTNLGLVTDAKNREEFQLWRGMTELGDYVACSPTKRQALNAILRAGHALRNVPARERRQKSFLIVDTPGSGKSYLLECLTRELGLTLMHFNVTRIDSKNEIFRFLDDVSRTQRSHEDPVLIFIDEIDDRRS